MKAIETVYRGYRYRSRLEARWAVFFDALGIKYEYEKEGYDLDEVGWYLPDFWLPDQGIWVEIKADTPTEEELQKAYRLVIATRKPVFVFGGDCWYTTRAYRFQPADFEHDIEARMSLRLASIDKEQLSRFSSDVHMPTGIWLSEFEYRGYNHEDRQHKESWVYYKHGFNLKDKTTWHYPEYWLECTVCHNVWLETNGYRYRCSGRSCKVSINSSRLIAAYTAARQARFEHGES